MKQNKLTKLALGLLAASALSSTVAMAGPIPITGSISFLGNAALNTSSLATASAFTSFTGDYVNEVAGDYVAVPTLSGDSVGFTPFTFYTGGGVTSFGTRFSSTPVPSALLTNPLWSFTAGGVTYQFDASGTITVSQNTGFLNVSGTGLAIITGGSTDYLATTGTWTITETNTGSTFSFGATSGTSAAPDSGATALMITLGLFGIALGVVAQRRRLVKA